MKIKMFFVCCLVLFFSSCVSVPEPMLSEDNIKFEQESGTKIVYLLRGLFSMKSEFKDNDFSNFQESIMQNNVTFILVGNVDYRAQLNVLDGKYIIKVNDIMKNYQDVSIWVYFNSLIGCVAKMEGITGKPIESQKNAEYFARIREMYEGIGDQTSLDNDEWIKQNKIRIEGNTIY